MNKIMISYFIHSRARARASARYACERSSVLVYRAAAVWPFSTIPFVGVIVRSCFLILDCVGAAAAVTIPSVLSVRIDRTRFVPGNRVVFSLQHAPTDYSDFGGVIWAHGMQDNKNTSNNDNTTATNWQRQISCIIYDTVMADVEDIVHDSIRHRPKTTAQHASIQGMWVTATQHFSWVNEEMLINNAGKTTCNSQANSSVVWRWSSKIDIGDRRWATASTTFPLNIVLRKWAPRALFSPWLWRESVNKSEINWNATCETVLCARKVQ